MRPQWDERLCVWCKRVERNDPYVGSFLRDEFPYAEIIGPDTLKARVHMPRDDNCRCLLVRIQGSTLWKF